MGVIRQVAAATLIGLAASAGSPPDPARAQGLPAAQSDSACAAHVPGRDPNDYVKICAELIAQLKDTLAKCDAVARLPDSARDRADPQEYCRPENVSRIRDQLAAAYNDRAYFLIQCKGTENYRRAVEDLDAALRLFPGYSIATRNRAIAYMLLGEHAKAKADFASLITALASGTDKVLIRPTDEAEVRLGLGYAQLGLCDAKPAQEELVEAERLSIVPVIADHWVRAAAMFGQGLGLKLKGSAQGLIAERNNAVTAPERDRLKRYAATLTSQGEARMQAARALVRTIDADIRDRFSIEESVVINKCRGNQASA